MPRKVGDVVRIYEDVFTEKKLEGEAKLTELISEDEEREFWLVEFTRSHERHPRWIKKSESKEKLPSGLRLEPESKTVCSKLQHAIGEEQKAIDEYEELWKEIDRLGETGLATGVIHILEEERSHYSTLIRIKEALAFRTSQLR
jgi:rubrerythrin